MSLRSYTGGRLRRQSVGIVLCLLGLSLGGCAGMGLPFGEAQSQAATAQSIKPAAAFNARVSDPVASSDWEMVRRSVSSIPADGNNGRDVAWHNLNTGSDGTVSAGPVAEKDDTLCRNFTATINAPSGIRGYSGQACRAGKSWRLNGISASDAAVL